MKKTVKNQKGFTLMEALLVTVIFAMTTVAIFSVFQMGMHIWRRTQGSSAIQRKAMLAVEKMGKDLRQQFRTETKILKPAGSAGEISMPGIIPVRQEDKTVYQYGLIRYRWDSGRKEICKQERSATALFRNRETPCVPIASGITKFKMQYFLYDGIGEKFSWYDQFDEQDEPPLAVRISMTLLGPEKNSKERNFTKTILVQAGGPKEKEEEVVNE